jgi:hypothetical protein
MLLDPQRILFIGIHSGAIPVRTSKFFDLFNIDDFQILAWNVETFVAEIQEKTGQPFQSHHHSFVYHRFRELYGERMRQILQWVRQGHVLAIFPYKFNPEMETDGPQGVINVNINQLPPFNLVELTHVSEDSPIVADRFHADFNRFNEIFTYNLVLSGEDIIPLFLTSGNDPERSIIAGAAFRVGRGTIVFSPPPKIWDHPKLLDYLEALLKLPDMLNRPVDPLPDRTRALEKPALWLAGFAALIIMTIALAPFWAPQVDGLLPWGGKSPAAMQEYAALAARLTEIEKRSASSSFDVNAIKSAESALARRVDQLEAALSHLQKLPAALPSNTRTAALAPAASPGLLADKPAAAPAPPAASQRLSTEEIAELLARGDAFLSRGDIVSARLFYERAANAGDGRAALRVGTTFDRAFLGRDVLPSVQGDPAKARLWYQRARDLGEAEAEQRLKSLETKRAN